MTTKTGHNSTLRLPTIGQGVGEYRWDESHIDVLRAGIDLGLTFIDTAESYDDGRSEEIVGKAVRGLREKVLIGTKVAPQHHSREDLLKAVEGSLRRMNTDYIDIYQIHWPNPSVPLEETLQAIETAVSSGKVRHVGVGNFYLEELKRAVALLSSARMATLQVEYNLFDRSVEDAILPYCQSAGIFLIAYSPLDQGRIFDGKEKGRLLEELAVKYGKTASQIALRWLTTHRSVVAIPKATNMKHVRENAASNFPMEDTDIAAIHRAFRREPMRILPSRIRVSTKGEGNRLVYQTVEEAIDNKLGHVPSPVELSRSIVNEEAIKPVRLTKSDDRSGQYDFDLVEGRIRYWAWVIAHGDVPIAGYVREDWPH